MISIPCIFDGFRSLKDRSYKLTFETRELTPVEVAELGVCLLSPGYLAFNKDVFTKEMLDSIENLNCDYDDPSERKSKRLQKVLYVYWKQNSMGYSQFDDFYNHWMEKFIDYIKKHLLP